MNKLQQEIIEIIEPYMDKTLSEGVIFYKKWNQTNVVDYFNEESQEVDGMEIPDTVEEWYFKIKSNWDNKGFLDSIRRDKSIIEFKIIWHYDITAVLKYIHSRWYYWSYCSKNCIEFADKSCVDDQEDWTTEFWIKNKPLHLYTEQENKDLLDLLKKIKC